MLNFVKVLAISPLKVLPGNDTPTPISTTTQSNILKLEEVGLFIPIRRLTRINEFSDWTE